MCPRRTTGLCCALFLVSTTTAPLASPTSGNRLGGRVFDASSGVPVSGAQISIASTRIGTRSTMDGRFLLVGLDSLEPDAEFTIRHPCFYTVRVELAGPDSSNTLDVGLPFRQPPGSERPALPEDCSRYGARTGER